MDSQQDQENNQKNKLINGHPQDLFVIKMIDINLMSQKLNQENMSSNH